MVAQEKNKKFDTKAKDRSIINSLKENDEPVLQTRFGWTHQRGSEIELPYVSVGSSQRK
jgi:hypothetical protein